MSKLLYSATMSLDGFIAGAGGDMSWLKRAPGPTPSPEIDDLVSRIGALLIGNRTFTGDDPNKGTDKEGAFGGQWQGPSIVLTHEPPGASEASEAAQATGIRTSPTPPICRPRSNWPRTPLRAATSTCSAPTSPRQCLEAGLLDEVLVLIAPVLLGDGTRLFEHPGGTNIRLEPLDPEATGPASLWFRVAR